jgi:2'-5' RNA ligase
MNAGDLDRDSWRIFCAVEIEHAARLKVLQHISRLQAALPDARATWSRDSNLHLTLKFVGDTPRASVSKFSEAISRATAGVDASTIYLEHADVFPRHGPPRVLWIGMDDSEGRLAQLQSRIESEAMKEAFAREERPFTPHLTVARLRHPRGARALASAHQEMGFERTAVEVSEVLVIRSELGSAGSKYTVISRHALNRV